jgi:hypothetical protein
MTSTQKPLSNSDSSKVSFPSLLDSTHERKLESALKPALWGFLAYVCVFLACLEVLKARLVPSAVNQDGSPVLVQDHAWAMVGCCPSRASDLLAVHFAAAPPPLLGLSLPGVWLVTYGPFWVSSLGVLTAM